MNPLISVIVPIYNSDEYLQDCVQSILSQTYKNLEIILVDDGSTDRCPQICDEYAKQDSRIKVIHKNNGGASSARNAGLDIAKGDYIGFVDCDDWINLEMYGTLLSFFNNPKIGIVGCLFYRYTDLECFLPNYFSHTELLLEKDDLVKSFLSGEVVYSVCTKLFKRESIEELRFRDGYMSEDLYFTFSSFLKCKSLDMLYNYKPIPLYYYRQVSSSIMHTQLFKVNEHVLCHFRYFLQMIDNKESIYSLVQARYLSDLVYFLGYSINFRDSRFAYWQKELRKIQFLKCRHIGFRHKLMCIVLEYFPRLWNNLTVRDFCTKCGTKLPIN